MNTQGWEFRGLLVVSEIEGSKTDCFPVGSDLTQRIVCRNDNAPECFVAVRVTCAGPYVSTAHGASWQSKEKRLAGRRSPARGHERAEDFRVELRVREHPEGEIRPASETILVEVFWRRGAQLELKPVGLLEHTIWVI